MSEGRYNKVKMTNYLLISALFFLSGFWKLLIIETQDYLPAARSDEAATTITAFLFFAFIFLVMGLRHAIWHYKEKYRHHAAD